MITIGMYLYLIVHTCATLGDITYPIDDSNGQRIFDVCTDYGLEQTKEIEMHEIVHACLHNHKHHFLTKKDLEIHLQILPEQDEEFFTANTAHCIVQAWDKASANNFYSASSTDSLKSNER